MRRHAIGFGPEGPAGMLILLLALFALAATWQEARRTLGADFYQFWVIGQAIGRPGVGDAYSAVERNRLAGEFLDRALRSGSQRQYFAADQRRVLQSYSTPFLYAMFRISSSGDYERDFRNYQLLLILCYVASILILCRILGHSPLLALAAAVILTVWFEPFRSDLRVGNVNSIQLGALASYIALGALGWRWRHVAGGLVLGLGAAFKPNLVAVIALLGLVWIVNRRPSKLLHHVAGMAIAAGAAFAAGSAAFGSVRAWTDWLRALGRLRDDIPVGQGNFAPARLLSDWLGIDATAGVAMLSFGVAAYTVWRIRRRPAEPGRERAEDIIAVSLGGLLMSFALPLAWVHYYVLAVPAILLVLRQADGEARHRVALRYALAALAIVALSIKPVLDLG